MMNPMAWLSTLDSTLASPQARGMMAEALRAMADVLEKPRAGATGSRGDMAEGQDVVSAARSLGADIVSAPLEIAAAAFGAAGEAVTSAVGVPFGESRGTGDSQKGSTGTSSQES
jgi:hypothetical protein